MLFIRAGVSMLAMAGLMGLVYMQIVQADYDRFLTVEQLVSRNIRGLSFDRHYAMVLDFCILPGAVALAIFLCVNQWEPFGAMASLAIAIAAILLCLYVLWIGGTEAHVHDGKPTEAGYIHALYAVFVVWVFLLTLCFTPKPEPVLLLIFCIVVPAFFFVGTHMFLGMINIQGSATSFPSNPLHDYVGWSVLVIATALTWWRSYMLIPTSFWDNLK
jgi:hypothetical protein